MSQLPRSSTRARLNALIGDRRRTVLALAICSTASGLTEAGILALLAQIAQVAVKGGSHVHQQLGPLHLDAHISTLFVVAFALTLTRIALQAPLSILPARIAASVQARLRKELFDSYTRAGWAVQSSDREGHLQETMTSQVLQATTGALQATQLVIAGFSFLVLMVSALALNAVAAAAVLTAAILLFALLRPLNTLGARLAKLLSLAQLEYAGGISEASRLAEETQVFGVGAAQRARVGGLIGNAEALFFRAQLVGRLSPSLYQSVVYLILVGGLAGLYAAGSGHFAALSAVILLMVRAGTYGQQVQGSYQGLRQSLPFVERLHDAVRRYEESVPLDGGQTLPSVDSLAFEDISFAYRTGHPVLEHISFEVIAGEAIGVVGPSGAGKSTLVQLLLQLRRPNEGRYLVNGVPAGEFARSEWQRRVAYVSQEPRLIHATVAENIRYFREIDDEAVERAGQLARIHDDILGWPNGYETIVGPRADAVSGGQQQRICLARALAARPEVLVLDEPTSALDPHSEKLIGESLIGLKHEMTLFVIAHRMSTLDVCDRVMVIVDGKLVAFDTTALLKQSNSYYRSASTPAAPGVEGPTALPQDDGRRPRQARPLEVSEAAGATRPAAARVQRGRVPDFFIVGHAKSGTTALYEMLRRHPQIYMPDAKEPWFLASELRVRTPPRPGGTPETLEEYVSLFEQARPEQRVGEASALYLWSRTAAGAIADVQPAARIVAILREPASFLRSLHLQFVQTYIETESDLRKSMSLERERRAGRQIPRYTYWPQALLYSDHVRYVEQLRRYHAVFAPEQVLVLIYDDFRRDNEGSVRAVLRFLEVDDTTPIDVVKANPTVRVRSQRVHELVHAVSVGRGPVSLAVKASVKTLTPRGLRRDALHATQRRVLYGDPGDSPSPDESLMLELRRRFKGEVEALSEYLGRDLVSLWGYDALG
ncbi:MAG TPA: ATP-binding cassette domain-containing protein [Solirubrobacteraceae bacterium]|nr:ATP-binding cassette domain-containing protein [Solirubrobacteraceae bacterium]